jgi:hypothetical protein
MVAIVSILLAALFVAVSCFAQELSLSFNYDIPDGFSAEESVDPDTGYEIVILTGADTVISIGVSSFAEFVGIDLTSQGEAGLADVLALLKETSTVEEKGLTPSVTVGGEGVNPFIEMSDDSLTILVYIEINPEDGSVLLYSVTNSKGESLTDDQLISLDLVLNSNVFSEG